MRKKILFFALDLLAILLLSGCTGPSAWPGLTASGDVAYLANTNAVFAVNVKTGAELWQFKINGGFLGTPSIFVTNPVMTEDGLLIVPDSGNKHILYALDTNDIKDNAPNIEWTFSEVKGHWIATPLIVGNRLFAPNSDGNLYVLDVDDGRSEKQAIKVIRLSGKADQTDRLWAQPITDGTRLFVTSLDHRIYAISLETYEVEWSHQLDAAIPSAPALGADGMLYVGSLSKKLERFDPVSGDHESVKDTNDWVWGTPVVDGDMLYFGDVAGYFYSYNTATRDWNWEPVKLDGAITSSPLILNNQILLVTESGDIFSVNKESSEYEVWYHPNTKKVGNAYTTPVLTGGYVLAAYLNSDYYLVALDSDGDMKWTFPQK
jgi:outer membrane protein assembly factor BamB